MYRKTCNFLKKNIWEKWRILYERLVTFFLSVIVVIPFDNCCCCCCSAPQLLLGVWGVGVRDEDDDIWCFCGAWTTSFPLLLFTDPRFEEEGPFDFPAIKDYIKNQVKNNKFEKI